MQRTTDRIIFSQDWYGVVDYVSFGGEAYEIDDFDVKSAIYDSFDSWRAVNYSVVFDDDVYWPEEIININDSREFSFEITYHTYDAMGDGIEPFYYKQKVIDDFRIAGWKS